MNALSYAYMHHAPASVKQAAIKQAGWPEAISNWYDAIGSRPWTYSSATEEGKIPAALLLGLLGGGLGAGGAALLSKKNKTRNALIAGLLGATAGGLGGYYGAELPTGLKLRNTILDPTFGGVGAAGSTWSAKARAAINDWLSYGNSDTSLTVGQLAQGLSKLPSLINLGLTPVD